MERILFITRVDRAYLVKKLQEYILKNCIKSEIVVMSDDIWSTCRMSVNHYIYISPDTSLENKIKDTVIQYNVKGIFVASNYDLEHIILIADWLKKNGVCFYAPDENTLSICLDKKKQKMLLDSYNILTPKSYNFEKIFLENSTKIFPLIIKPCNGQGTKNVFEIHNIEELKYFYKRRNDFIVETKLDGKEYTVDCFNNYNGELILSIPRERFIIKGAHTIVAQICMNRTLVDIGLELSKILKITGPWNFQVFEENENFIVHDINPRVASGIGFSIVAGAPFEKLIVDYLLRRENNDSRNIYELVEDKKMIFQYSSYE